MMITPKYYRVEWNHLHIFQGHPIKRTPHSPPSHSLVSCTKVYSQHGIWIDFACFVACGPPGSIPSPIIPFSYYSLLQAPSLSSGPCHIWQHASLLFRRYYCLIASYHHTHSKSKDIYFVSIPIPPASHLSDTFSPLSHSCIQCHSCARLNDGLMVVDRSSHSGFNIRPTFREHYPDPKELSTSISSLKRLSRCPRTKSRPKGKWPVWECIRV